MYYNSPSELVDELNKAIDDAVGNIMKYLDIIQYSSYTSDEDALHQYSTELDQKQLALQKEEIVSHAPPMVKDIVFIDPRYITVNLFHIFFNYLRYCTYKTGHIK